MTQRTPGFYPSSLYLRESQESQQFTGYTFALTLPHIFHLEDDNTLYVRNSLQHFSPFDIRTVILSDVIFDLLNPYFEYDPITKLLLYRMRFLRNGENNEHRLRQNVMMSFETRVDQWRSSIISPNYYYGITKDPVCTLSLYTYLTIVCDILEITSYTFAQIDLELPLTESLVDIDWNGFPDEFQRSQSLYTLGGIEEEIPDLIQEIRGRFEQSPFLSSLPSSRYGPYGPNGPNGPKGRKRWTYLCFASRAFAPLPSFVPSLVGMVINEGDQREEEDRWIRAYTKHGKKKYLDVVLVFLPENQSLWLCSLVFFRDYPFLRTVFNSETGYFDGITYGTDDVDSPDRIDASHWYGIYQGKRYHIVNFDPLAYDCFVAGIYFPLQIPLSYYRFLFSLRSDYSFSEFHNDKQSMFNHLIE